MTSKPYRISRMVEMTILIAFLALTHIASHAAVSEIHQDFLNKTPCSRPPRSCQRQPPMPLETVFTAGSKGANILPAGNIAEEPSNGIVSEGF